MGRNDSREASYIISSETMHNLEVSVCQDMPGKQGLLRSRCPHVSFLYNALFASKAPVLPIRRCPQLFPFWNYTRPAPMPEELGNNCQ
jgi:hypothetical protein